MINNVKKKDKQKKERKKDNQKRRKKMSGLEMHAGERNGLKSSNKRREMREKTEKIITLVQLENEEEQRRGRREGEKERKRGKDKLLLLLIFYDGSRRFVKGLASVVAGVSISKKKVIWSCLRRK